MALWECTYCHHLVVRDRRPEQCTGCGSLTSPWNKISDEEVLRQTLMWLIERVLKEQHRSMLYCGECWHDITDHSDGDACRFPASRGAPAALCTCGRFRSEHEADRTEA